jgi:hypothetical protein
VVTAALTNVDANRSLTLSGLDLAAPTNWPIKANQTAPESIGAGGNASISWTVTVPAQLDVAAPATLTFTSSSTLEGTAFTDTRSLSATPDIPPVPPITDTLSTFTDDGATFTQNAGTGAVTGAGTDIFNGFGTVADDYGVIYKPAAAATQSTVSVRVQSFDAPKNNSKAALVLRNDFTQPGKSTGYISVAVQKDGGVTLFSDSNGDGYLDAYHPASGSPTSGPVYLRLNRDGDTVTGFWSLDGAVWNRVGSAITLVTPSAQLDAGMAYVSAAPGAPGTAVFNQFRIVNSS